MSAARILCAVCKKRKHSVIFDKCAPCEGQSSLRRGGYFNRSQNKFGAVRSVCNLGHHHASKLESAWCQSLQLLEKGGAIRGLRQQVTHTLYLAPVATVPFDMGKQKYKILNGWCSCFGDKQARAPEGFERFRAIRPDFEYEEAVSADWHDWIVITADAKGAGQEAQMLAYKIFELIHGRPVRLFRRMP